MLKFALIPALLFMIGCTGSRTLYSNGGVTIKQVGADPTPINGGYNLLIVERDGFDPEIRYVQPTRTIAEQLAMPAATVGAAAFTATQDGDSVSVSNNSSSKSKAKSNSSADRTVGTVNRNVNNVNGNRNHAHIHNN